MNKELKLTVADVLKRPLFQDAEVIAGSRGLSRPIRWVHILEAAESGSFLNGGELILSTGVGVGESREKRIEYLNELIRRKAVGLCIELGSYIPEIPPDMREIADHYEFPLLVFRRPVRFVDITLDLHENIVNRHIKALRELENYSRDLQRLTLQSNGLPRILAHFQSVTQTQTFFFPIDGSPVFAPSMNQTIETELTHILQKTLLQDPAPPNASLLPISERKQILYQPIAAMGHVLAYLGIILFEREPDEFLHLTLDYTSTAVAQLLLRRMFAQERALDNQTQLLDDILQGRVHREEDIRVSLGIKPGSTRPPQFVCFIMEAISGPIRPDAETDSPFHDLLVVFRSILSRHKFRPLLRGKGNRLYGLLLDTDQMSDRRLQCEKSLREIEQTCKQALDSNIKIRFGISRASSRYADARLHFQEAEQVLAFPSAGSPFFEDLGIYRLLLQIKDGYALNSFIDDYLGPLLQYDADHGSQLVLTLRVFLDQGCSKQDTADRLYIRRQTLYHRLDKISELLGDTFTSAEHRVSLELALRAYEMLQEPSK
ncbi:PucR family transcriptional regulator [Effusibacillus lacus]|uniref:Transcriptional regulator n=1 Tax=Effusibacillus lacus TaxID=1348429 RepID=A0A292YHV0_9BACL|nr:PucR family transcriptional regulator ligand-binding domain-containing protein [Effusibacillus lacus]TCS74798.1 purine catabolism regulator [Effusibacillus lacus]GAX88606.1 transcriptional regulator [Effusibacillus lacus]